MKQVLCERLCGHFLDHHIPTVIINTDREAGSQIIQIMTPWCGTSEVIWGFLLVEFDAGGLHLLVRVVRNSFLQLAGLRAERRRHQLHHLRRVLLVPPVHLRDLSASSSLSVPDVLSQQDRLQAETRRRNINNLWRRSFIPTFFQL